MEIGAESNNSACQLVPTPKAEGLVNNKDPPEVTLPSFKIAPYWAAFKTSIKF